MAGRIIHLAIAKLIIDKLKGEGVNLHEQAFCAGNILVDSTNVQIKGETAKNLAERRKKKISAHFQHRDERKLPIFDYTALVRENSSRMNSSFMVGYLSHLISDELFCRLFSDKMIDLLPLGSEERISNTGKYYRDFDRLNELLIREYELDKFYGKLKDNPKMNFSKIDTDGRRELFKQLDEDFYPQKPTEQESGNYPGKYWRTDLELFDFEDIKGFINKSISEFIEFATSEITLDDGRSIIIADEIRKRDEKTRAKNPNAKQHRAGRVPQTDKRYPIEIDR